MAQKQPRQSQGADVRARKAHKKAKRKKVTQGKAVTLPVIRPDTAGIDIGATEIYVAVSPERDAEPVRCFQSFTADLKNLIQWLHACGVKSVAMESTGVYWIPLYQMLAEEKIEICLVNAKHFHNVPGRKTDVQDCQWLQYLHAVGLLRGSFRPDQVICAVRTLLRHRGGLVEMASEHVLHMQKSMEQMNLKLHHVISDIKGVTGLRIVDAIVGGERRPEVLAKLRDERIKASEEVMIKSLEGDYRCEHLITLKQSLEAYRFYQKQMAALDESIEAFLEEVPSKIDLREHPLPVNKNKTRRQNNAPAYDMRGQCYRILGVDITEIPGVGPTSAQIVVTEAGDLRQFSSASAFANWVGLCPNNSITGGKIQKVGTGHGSSRTNTALRLAAQSVENMKNPFGSYFRKMRSRMSRPEAITAVAHKIARTIYAMVTKGQKYDESRAGQMEAQQQERHTAKLRKQAKAMGFDLVPREIARA